MRKHNLVYLFILIVILGSLNRQKVYAQANYKGGNKHVSLPEDIMPDTNGDYDINKPISGILKDSLNRAVRDMFARTGMMGLSAAVLAPGKGIWQTNTGFISKPDQKKVGPNTVFYWASVGKLVTGTVIMQLIGEKKLKHDSKLSKWFPQFQNANKITIDQLLAHTSGLYSFNADSTFNKNKQHYYSPEQLVELALKKKNLFPPGERWSYSNTGYLLLALIAEKIESKTYAQIVEQRIAEPLHLASLKALDPKEQLDNLALAHDKGKVVNENYAVPLGAGNLVSNARDMVVFLHALLAGKLGPVAKVYGRLNDLYPMFDKGTYYGQGIMLYDFKEINKTNALWIGHSGGTETYKAVVVYDVNSKAFVAASVNQAIPAEAVARKLLSQIK